MTDRVLKIFITLLLAAGPALARQEVPAQETPPAPEPVFVRLTLYPTASLSRYDYNNDVDLYELRAYAEIRKTSQLGEAIRDARVTVLSEVLEFHEDHFEKRIIVPRESLPEKAEISIVLAGRPPIVRTFPLPSWLVLESPRPAIVDPAQDLTVAWRFTAFQGSVNIRVYDFKKGGSITNPDNLSGKELVVPAAKIPPSTIIRVQVISTWISKQYLGGAEFARGSEINLIPWSQVFIRTK